MGEGGANWLVSNGNRLECNRLVLGWIPASSWDTVQLMLDGFFVLRLICCADSHVY